MNKIEDPCYNIQISKTPEEDYFDTEDNPITAPTSILREVISEHGEELDSFPIHPALCDKVLPLDEASALKHSIGAWHVAGQCLEFGRILYSKHPEDLPGTDSTTLSQRLVLGADEADTLLEEFCLAAFFQAFLSRQEDMGTDAKDDATADPSTIIRKISAILNMSRAFTAYQSKSSNAVQISVIAYWVSGKGPIPTVELKKPNEKSNKDYLDDRLLRTRRMYFSPDAPLNLRHIDLVARSFWVEKQKRNPSYNFRLSLLRFLTRIRLAQQVDRATHLLPKAHWERRCPYFLPDPEDDPPYKYLIPLIKGLELVRDALSRSPRSRNHSITMSFSRSRNRRQDGFLRLSLIRHLVDDSALEIHEKLRAVTAPLPRQQQVSPSIDGGEDV